MKNCLVTTLPGVSAKDTPKLGELRLDISEYNEPGCIVAYNPDTATFPQVIKVVGDGTLNTNGDKEIIVESSANNELQFATDVVLSMTDKYNLGYLSFPYAKIDLSELKYCTNLTALALYRATGDVANLSDKSMGGVYLNGSAVYGDIVEGFGNSVNMTNLNLLSCRQMTGQLEPLLVKFLEKRTTATRFRVFLEGTTVTINNKTAPSGAIFATFGSNSISVGTTEGASDIASYNGSTWIYGS